MKQGSLQRSAFAAAFSLVLAGSAFAADMDKSSPVIVKGAPSSASAPAAACTDSAGKPVSDPAVCASGACKDSGGKPVTDPAACASVSSGARSGASWNLKENVK